MIKSHTAKTCSILVRGVSRWLAEAGYKPFFMILGRTDLRKGVSEAKFDAEADFDVKKSLAPPKSPENHEKKKKIAEIFSKKFFGVKKTKVANRLKRVFPKFRANRSQVRGANARTNDERRRSNYAVVWILQ